VRSTRAYALSFYIPYVKRHKHIAIPLRKSREAAFEKKRLVECIRASIRAVAAILLVTLCEGNVAAALRGDEAVVEAALVELLLRRQRHPGTHVGGSCQLGAR